MCVLTTTLVILKYLVANVSRVTVTTTLIYLDLGTVTLVQESVSNASSIHMVFIVNAASQDIMVMLYISSAEVRILKNLECNFRYCTVQRYYE